MKTLFPLIGLFACFRCLPVNAAENETTQSLSIFCPVNVDGLKLVFVKTGEGIYNDITLSTANVVEVENVLAVDGQVPLHGPIVGDKTYPVIATADISGTRQPLVVLVPGTKEEGHAYEAKVVEGASDQFPIGSFQLVNLSPNPVRVTAGAEVIEIKAGANALFKPKIPAGESMPVTIDQKSGENWQLVSSAQWASRDDRRSLVCFLLDPASKRMMVKSVPLRGNTVP